MRRTVSCSSICIIKIAVARISAFRVCFAGNYVVSCTPVEFFLKIRSHHNRHRLIVMVFSQLMAVGMEALSRFEPLSAHPVFLWWQK